MRGHADVRPEPGPLELEERDWYLHDLNAARNSFHSAIHEVPVPLCRGRLSNGPAITYNFIPGI